MSAYSDYLDQLRELLHDANDKFWSAAEKLKYINDGRNRMVRDSGCYRVLQSSYISRSLEVFPFGGVCGVNLTTAGTGYSNSFAVTFTGGGGTGAAATATATSGIIRYITVTNAGSGYSSAPTPVLTAGGGVGGVAAAGIINSSTFDVVNLTIYWGNSRVVLGRWAWSNFNAKLRYYVGYTGMPKAFSIYSYNSVYIQPLADQTYQVEWDTVMQPPLIVDATTTEVIPFPFQSPVAFYAAYRAKLKQQAWQEAEAFAMQYKMQAGSALNTSFTRANQNPYGGR